jgi:LysM repeat protein
MNRIATTLTTLTASALLCQTLGAAEPTMEALNSKINVLESRITTLEAAMKSENSSYSYSNAAVIEATKAGQSSATPAASGTYVIQDGDTLGKIAEKFKIERKSLLEANRLSEGQPIYIGETLMVPGAAPAPAPAPATVPAPAPNANMAETGKPADAKKDSVVIGETKKPEAAPVPAPATTGTKTHKIVKGDTLTSVAKKYNTSVESIKSANGLRSDIISLGQTLKIPATQTASTGTTPAPEKKQDQTSAFQYDNELLRADETYGYYTVNNGDNLYALARDFFTTMSELQRINRLGASTTIFPGNEIIVPTAKYNAYHKTGEIANR